MIELKDITKCYGSLTVLKNIDLSIETGKVTSIVGASGAGKSTLLQIMGTLLAPTQGTISIDGIRTDTLSSDRLAQIRNTKVGFVFQFHHLLPEFSALENICIPGFIAGRNRKIVEKEASELLERLELSHRAAHKPAALSGGEQQRVAIARALINSPAILLADEPSGNLDSRNRDELHALFFRLREELGQTIVLVTHDDGLSRQCDRRIEMKDGIIIDDASLCN